MNVLDELVAAARERCTTLKVPARRFEERASFRQALLGRNKISIIAEIKRKSPSRGSFTDGLNVLDRAALYERAGASAISVLTEPTRFGGSLDDLTHVAEVTQLPLLMKDFVVDATQIRAGRAAGASAALLIVRALDDSQLRELSAACKDEGLDALVECHSSHEVERALGCGATIIGINNRDLDTFEIDTQRAQTLLSGLTPDVVAVAESGYSTGADLAPLNGVADAALIGGALMDSDDVEGTLRELTS